MTTDTTTDTEAAALKEVSERLRAAADAIDAGDIYTAAGKLRDVAGALQPWLAHLPAQAPPPDARADIQTPRFFRGRNGT